MLRESRSPSNGQESLKWPRSFCSLSEGIYSSSPSVPSPDAFSADAANATSFMLQGIYPMLFCLEHLTIEITGSFPLSSLKQEAFPLCPVSIPKHFLVFSPKNLLRFYRVFKITYLSYLLPVLFTYI